MTLKTWLAQSIGRYHNRASALMALSWPVDANTRFVNARDMAAFVLFTPRQTYECALRAWWMWRHTGEVTGALPETRRRAIEALPAAEGIYRRAGESAGAWRVRLEALRGLGPVKAPFLQCLLEPLASDVDVCIDVWMARHYLRQERASRYEMAAVQGVHAAAARRLGWRPFPLQWAIWDYVRSGGGEGQIPLLVNETDIARDLGGTE